MPILLLTHTLSYGQNSFDFIEGIGIVEISNITPEEARIQAIKKAKIDALNKAGIPELFSDFSSLRKLQNQNDFHQEFNQIMTSEVFGFIKNYVVKQDSILLHTDNSIYREVSILADIQKFNIDTAWFSQESIRTHGIRSSYFNNSKLSFSVDILNDGYLTVILTNENEVQLIYPNSYEKPQYFRKNSTQDFPQNPGIDYKLSTEKEVELNTLIVIFSKKELILSDFSGFNELLEFFAKINPNERKVQVIDFTIRKHENQKP